MTLGYCVKCKAKREIKDPSVVSVNGHSAAKGTCPKCGTKMFCFLPGKSKK